MVANHFWPSRIPGGYLGVDVFFVISGYLIVGHLQREASSTGRIALLAFWARRARRLLPAALLVLLATAAAVIAWVPSTLWRDWLAQVGASAMYAENWLLAAQGVEYSAEDRAPSPVQHFWSLSVEEQLYLVVPVAMGLLAARFRKTRLATAVALALIAAASLTYAVTQVANGSPSAHFETTARAWEFVAGGMLALIRARTLDDRSRAVVSWAGWAALLCCVAVFRADTGVPGAVTIVPVAATAAVILAGAPTVRWSATRVVSARPIRWLGGISYSLYLWHWPLLIITPFVLGERPSSLGRVLLLAIAVGLAWLTKCLVEDPVRRGHLVRRPPWVSIVGGLVCSSLVLAGCAAVHARVSAAEAAAARVVSAAAKARTSCVGAAAALPESGCDRPHAITALTDPAQAQDELTATTTYRGCQQVRYQAEVIRCEAGDKKSYTTTIALVGDSHMTQYLDALNAFGRAEHQRILSFVKSYCPGTGATDAFVADPASDPTASDCAEWGDAVLDRVASDPSIDAVVFSNFTERYAAGNPREGVGRPLRADDFQRAWERMRRAGKTVVAVRDIPHLGAVRGPECVAMHMTEYDPCAFPRAEASSSPASAPDPLVDAARTMAVPVVDFTDLFCDAATCHVVIGGLIAFADSNHMTATFSLSAADIVGSRLKRAIEPLR